MLTQQQIREAERAAQATPLPPIPDMPGQGTIAEVGPDATAVASEPSITDSHEVVQSAEVSFGTGETPQDPSVPDASDGMRIIPLEAGGEAHPLPETPAMPADPLMS